MVVGISTNLVKVRIFPDVCWVVASMIVSPFRAAVFAAVFRLY